MPNSDNTFGTFNKRTKIISQKDDGSTALTVFSNVNEAKAFIFTDDALTMLDECCTVLEWALVADDNGDNTKLKTTFAFGTKGVGTAEADDWAEQYNTRKTNLKDANNYVKLSIGFLFEDSSDHIV